MTLDDYRKNIDKIDRELTRLLEERIDISGRIMRYKEMKNLPVLDSGREQEKFRTLESICSCDKYPYLKEILREIMAQSRAYQKDHSAWYGLLGRKLGHSLSADVHGAIADYDYAYFEREADELEDFMLKGTWKGINVTIPYKRKVMEFCSEISERACKCNSVNTVIRREDGSLYGDNTDYFGFKFTVENSSVEIPGSKAIVLGSGGVSGTVCRVLEEMGADSVSVISRQGGDNYDNLERHTDADIIVNTTPVGMFPERGKSLLELEQFSRCRAVFDLIYNPLRTKLLLDAKKLGIPAFGGLQMLVAQAVKASSLFTGKEIQDDEIDNVYRLIRRQRENIVLIGMPGCGKTSIGRRLSEFTGMELIDTDDLIRGLEGRSPEDVILSDGEDRFRTIESVALSVATDKAAGSAAEARPVIISCGGGIIERPENYYMAGENSRIVYIERTLNNLSTDGRPISARDGVKQIFERREEKYLGWSDITINNTSVEESATKLARILGYIEK